jgi:hypothetical protein
VPTVVVDREVLGETYGKTLRRLLEHSSRVGGFRLVDPRFPLSDEVLNSQPTVVLFGRTSRFLRRITSTQVRHVLVVHPGTLPDEMAGGIATEVWLPAEDELGVAAAWRTWAARKGAVVRQTEAIGQSFDGSAGVL